MSNSPGVAPPPPWGLTLIGALICVSQEYHCKIGLHSRHRREGLEEQESGRKNGVTPLSRSPPSDPPLS